MGLTSREIVQDEEPHSSHPEVTWLIHASVASAGVDGAKSSVVTSCHDL